MYSNRHLWPKNPRPNTNKAPNASLHTPLAPKLPTKPDRHNTLQFFSFFSGWFLIYVPNLMCRSYAHTAMPEIDKRFMGACYPYILNWTQLCLLNMPY